MNKVFITDYIDNPEIEKEVLGDELCNDINDSIEVLLVWHETIDKKFIDKFPKLKGIIRYGVGYDNIDLTYASSKGILVCNTPDYGIDEVSDTALAMILNIARGVSQYDFACRSYVNNWQENTIESIMRTSNCNIGIIGAGRIGGSLLLKANTIGFNTFFYDPYISRGRDKMLKSIQVEQLEELLTISDIISIHTPLTHETKGMVNKSFISKMKNSSSLVNTARGQIIRDLDDFYEPLKTGKIFSLALDVLPNEPPKNSRLIKSWKKREEWLASRLLINPHTAYYSKESYIEMRTKAANNALRIVKGLSPLNKINTISTN